LCGCCGAENGKKCTVTMFMDKHCNHNVFLMSKISIITLFILLFPLSLVSVRNPRHANETLKKWFRQLEEKVKPPEERGPPCEAGNI
jgi:hypothetical protein